MIFHELWQIVASAVGFDCARDAFLINRNIKPRQANKLIDTIHAFVLILFSLWQPMFDDDTWLRSSRVFSAGYHVSTAFNMSFDPGRRFSLSFIIRSIATFTLVYALSDADPKNVARIYFAEIVTLFVNFSQKCFYIDKKRKYPITCAANAVLTLYLSYRYRVCTFTELMYTAYASGEFVEASALTMLLTPSWYWFALDILKVIIFMTTPDNP